MYASEVYMDWCLNHGGGVEGWRVAWGRDLTFMPAAPHPSQRVSMRWGLVELVLDVVHMLSTDEARMMGATNGIYKRKHNSINSEILVSHKLPNCIAWNSRLILHSHSKSAKISQLHNNTSSAENQKSIIAVQRCFLENQKGAIAIDSV